jgi:hypothetical protein
MSEQQRRTRTYGAIEKVKLYFKSKKFRTRHLYKPFGTVFLVARETAVKGKTPNTT